jgi:hypothetical protein
MHNIGFILENAKLIPKKCGKVQIYSLSGYRCAKLILSFCGIINFVAPTRTLLKTYPQKMWKDTLFSIKDLFTNLSTFDVDKFVKKCAEMKKYI